MLILLDFTFYICSGCKKNLAKSPRSASAAHLKRLKNDASSHALKVNFLRLK